MIDAITTAGRSCSRDPPPHAGGHGAAVPEWRATSWTSDDGPRAGRTLVRGRPVGDGVRMNGAAHLARQVAGGAARALVAALSLALLAGTGYGWSVQRQLTHVVTSDVIDATTAPAEPDQPFTALLVGLDSRTDAAGNPLPPDLLAQLRAGADEGQLHTDTIILLHVPAGPNAQAIAISIPRDSFVRLANGGNRHKINSAYGRATTEAERTLEAQGVTGPDLDRRSRDAGRRALVATVQQFTGVPIDHYAEINLVGFVEMTEAVGGVPVCLKQPEREVRSGIDLPAGLQVVSGADALAFVRQRHDLEGGDLDRIARQQAFLAGMAGRVLSAGTLSDPAAVRRLVEAVTRHVVLDRGWELDRLIGQFRRMSGGDIRFVTIPTGTPALETPVDGIAVAVDDDEVKAFVQDTIARTDAAATAPTDTPSPTPTPTSAPTAPTTATTSPAAPPASGAAAPTTISAAGVTCVD
jgi:LCP family protein required for cell wall assembly